MIAVKLRYINRIANVLLYVKNIFFFFFWFSFSQHYFKCLETTINNNIRNECLWSSINTSTSSLFSQSLSSLTGQMSSMDVPLPTSPADTEFATSAVYISPVTGLHKNLSVR